MYVIKRNGVTSPVVADKIEARARKLSYNLVIPDKVIDRVIQCTLQRMSNGVHTCEIDKILADAITKDSDCDEALMTLAARIEVSNLHKQTIKRFSTVHNMIFEDDLKVQHKPAISETEHDFVVLHQDELDSAIISDRDFQLPYSTLIHEQKCLLHRRDDKIIERPSHRYMRTAISDMMAKNDMSLEAVLERYEKLSCSPLK